MVKTISYLGLGTMGSGMAANLLKAGYKLTVWNRNAEKCEPFARKGARVADAPADAVRDVDLIMYSLSNDQAVEDVVFGSKGILSGIKEGQIAMDTSTVLPATSCSSVNPSFSRKMAAEAARREIHFVDAPVTGSAPAAAEAKLVFWVGADPDDLERIRSLLLCMGNKIVHTGGQGMGTSMKMVVNLLLGTGMAAFAEAMALGEALGISRKMLFDSLLGTPPVAPFLASKREKIESGNYETEFPLRWMQKDMHLASVSAYESGVAMPLSNAAKELYRLAMREGYATEDFSAVYDCLTAIHESPAPAKV
jgi:3-hydroxyisobutyrate dehydrogenase-like beta-hydroxyacid dehydrogenase